MSINIISVEKIRTENPLEDVWRQLSLFESVHYSRQFLKEKHHDITDDELKKLSVTFASNVKQAHEYYSAASSISILTSPLLYYYGMMCLVNVLWASLNKTDKIKEHHGLRSKSDDSDILSLSNEYVNIHKSGSFPALYACFSDYPIEGNANIYIKDILSVIPELKPLYEKIYNDCSRTFKLTRDDYHLFFDHNDRPKVQDIFKNNGDFFKRYNVIRTPNIFDEFNGVCHDKNTLIKYPLQKNINGDIYFVFPIEVENTLYAIPEASAHFMVMHCLGMLVRYESEKWLQIVSGKISSDVNLIKWFIEISERKFPNMILNGLLSKEVQFTMSNESSG